MPPIRLDDLDQDQDHDQREARRHHRRQREPFAPHTRPGSRQTRVGGCRQSRNGRESFKCGHCRAFIGPTVSGGRHRNHCPLCLYSRHVDGARPGDRASSCRSLMHAIGVFARPKGEQVILHRCLGCDLERHTRVAADDNPVAVLRLPPVPPRIGRARVSAPEEEAIA